jgi:hypothetical protein
LHGAAAVPDAEMGGVTSGDIWPRLEQIFQRQLIALAFWFN